MYTTIKVTGELKHKLDDMKLQENESYAEVIEDLIEDRLSTQSKVYSRNRGEKEGIQEKQNDKLGRTEKRSGYLNVFYRIHRIC